MMVANSGYSNISTVLTSGQLLDGELNTLLIPLRVMAVGDSVTHGTAAANIMKTLWTQLRDNGCAADMVGPYRWADTSADADHASLDGLRADTAAATYVDTWTAAAKPEVVLIHLGSYDAFAGVPATTTVNSLAQVITKIRARRPNVTFLLARLIPTTTSVPANNAVSALNALLPGLVAAQTRVGSPVMLVDQATGFATTDLLDGIRPNASGVTKMSQRWYDAMVSAGLCKPVTPMTLLSRGMPVTVTGSTGAALPAKLTNGQLALYDEWVGTTTLTQPMTVEVDLGASRGVGLFRLSQYTGTSVTNVYNARDFRIAVRNATTDPWTDLVAVASNSEGATLHPVVPVNARYVRLTLARPNSFISNTNYSTLREFEVYGWATMPQDLRSKVLAAARNGAAASRVRQP